MTGSGLHPWVFVALLALTPVVLIGAAGMAWPRLRRWAGAWPRERRARVRARGMAWARRNGSRVLLGVGLTLSALGFLLALYLLARSLAVAFGYEWAWLGLTPGADKWPEIRNGLLIGTAALGAPFVIWRTWLASRQTEINQQSHFTDLYTKAVEMLGADKVVKRADRTETTEPNIEVRLGAIYALERIANQSDDDYRPIIETLCAYIRQNVGEPHEPEAAGIEPVPEPPDDREEKADERAARIVALKQRAQELCKWGESLREAAAKRGAANAARPDIRAALDVLMRRKPARRRLEDIEPPDPPRLDLEERPEDLPLEAAKARLARIANHRSAVLGTPGPEAWRLDLAAAALQGVVRRGDGADWRRMNLRRARMEGADLFAARMEGADLIEARMEGANLSGARMQSARATGAIFARSSVARADFTGAIDLTEAQMASALGDAATKRPEGMARPAHWAAEELDFIAADQDWCRWLAAKCPPDADWRETAPPYDPATMQPRPLPCNAPAMR